MKAALVKLTECGLGEILVDATGAARRRVETALGRIESCKPRVQADLAESGL